jgi:hypothetical protein
VARGRADPGLFALPRACDLGHWRNEQGSGLLDRWQQGLDGLERWNEGLAQGLLPDDIEAQAPGLRETFDRSAWSALQADGPAKALAAQLAVLAERAGVTRLSLLLPAELGQLPWETLPEFAPERLCLSRAVSLESWLRQRAAIPASALPASTHEHATSARAGGAPASRVLVADDASLPFGTAEEEQALAFHGGAPAIGGTSVLSVLRALTAPGGKHLLMHAVYAQLNPWASYLRVRAPARVAQQPLALTLRADADRDWISELLEQGADNRGRELLAAWIPPVLGVTPDTLTLSACEAARCGADQSGLATPVDLGPALLAGGAGRVIGALWPCNQEAAWLFYRTLFRAAQQAPQAAWYQLVHDARRTLQGLDSAALTELLSEADVAPDWQMRAQAGWIDPKRPSFWAPFVVLGNALGAPGDVA